MTIEKKGALTCVCDLMQDKHTCLNSCPKGMILRPDIMAGYDGWKQNLTGFNEKVDRA